MHHALYLKFPKAVDFVVGGEFNLLGILMNIVWTWSLYCAELMALFYSQWSHYKLALVETAVAILPGVSINK